MPSLVPETYNQISRQQDLSQVMQVDFTLNGIYLKCIWIEIENVVRSWLKVHLVWQNTLKAQIVKRILDIGSDRKVIPCDKSRAAKTVLWRQLMYSVSKQTWPRQEFRSVVGGILQLMARTMLSAWLQIQADQFKWNADAYASRRRTSAMEMDEFRPKARCRFRIVVRLKYGKLPFPPD